MKIKCSECDEVFEVREAKEGEFRLCPDCRVPHVYCHACSKAGGADRAIYHAEPACPDDGPSTTLQG